ncbi:ParA family protein [Streptomyces verrucosisporus]|uniref:ParA family protein n=1 Tax=Streptomyces verrucosisporus TaxID=1695161 RepID=UPI0027DA8BE8|nr:AAA family ATPase [Streptomyces verrucosisporus]
MWLLAGSLDLSRFEDKLSGEWFKTFASDIAALRTTTAFHRIVEQAAGEVGADIVLIDVGPNLGAINRAALIAADSVLMPLAHDARKPMFDLKAADGALGSTQKYVQTCYREFRGLAEKVLARTEELDGG